MDMYPRRIVVLLMALLICIFLLGQAPAPRYDVEVTRGVVYTTVAGEGLKLDIYQPRDAVGTVPVILAFHGGSWIANSRDELNPLAEVLCGEGYAVVSADYRLAPRHTFPAQVEDGRAVARWVAAHAAQYRWDMDRFVLLGLSAGGQIAALLATDRPADTPKPRCVVTLSSPLDFTGPAPSLKAELVVKLYLGASRQDKPELYRQASPITHVTAESPPFLLIHGMQDDTVPITQSARMHAALVAAKVPAEFRPVPNAGHILPTRQSVVGRAMLGHVSEYLHRQCAGGR
jgi:acetyl esterase/lipase